MSNPMPRAAPAADRKAIIDDLEKQLRLTPRATRPYEYAAVLRTAWGPAGPEQAHLHGPNCTHARTNGAGGTGS